MPVETELFPPPTLAIAKIHQGDCIDLMQQVESSTIDLAFADPPFNIGYDYDAYHDRQDADAYVAWSRAWIAEIHRVLKPNGTFWLAIGDEFAAELKVAAQHQVGFTTRSWVVWYYTFGVNCTRKFSRSHVHLFHFIKDENNFTFNAEDPQVRVPSARALVYADKRANPAGRLPDDTWIVRPAADDHWILRPQDLPDGFQATDDTWYYARVAGTFKERQGFHGCQMPEQLLGRIIRVSSNPGDVVLDPFAGSGTTLAVAKKLGRRWIGCEISEEYVRAATERLNGASEGDPLNGPADPIASAPSTANGRRLENVSASTVAIEPNDELPDSREPKDTRESPDSRERAPSAAAADGRARRPAPATDSVAAVSLAADSLEPQRTAKRELRELVREAIVDAFYQSHDGYSIDWLLASPQLQAAYHENCREAGLIGGPADWNRELMRLRKTGRFPKRGEIKKISVSDTELDRYNFAAEIAWRLTSDKFAAPSLDEILCDPKKTDYFDRTARRFAPRFEPAQLRWAALRLRKASRDLVNDVNQYHFVFATRDFTRFKNWRGFNRSRLSGQHGIYLLRDWDKRPVFIGLTQDLGRRLAQHADTRALADAIAHVSIIGGDDLPGQDYQDAFKEDLVRRYKPKWNMYLVGLRGESH
jgi:site-specific DNA-methyltransferase (adenine-specific)